MVKRCVWGTCKSDSRYPDRIKGLHFIPFPKPKANYEKCLLWIRLCGRPHWQFNPSTITKHTYICSKHFVDGAPSDLFPNPEDATGTPAKPSRPNPKRKMVHQHTENSKLAKREQASTDNTMAENAQATSRTAEQTVETTSILAETEQTTGSLAKDTHTARSMTEAGEITDSIAQKTAQTSSIAEEMAVAQTISLGEAEDAIQTCGMTESTAHISPVSDMSENTGTDGDQGGNTSTERLEDQEKEEYVNSLKTELNLHMEEIKALKKHIKDLECLTPEIVNESRIPSYFEYCTGFTYTQYNDLCSFFMIPSSSECPQANIPVGLTYVKTNIYTKEMPLRQQLLMVLMKLRNNWDMKDLAFKFNIDLASVSIIFRAWVDYMYNKLASLSIWPHRDIITLNMPDKYKEDYPTTFGILDCTELKIQKPSSLQLQSQTFSDYKSTNTLKALIACDPRGAVTFISTLFTGSISDREIFNQCGISTLLKGLIACGYLKKGDALMADKGFLIEKDVESLGLKLNIPPFNKSNTQMPVGDVLKTKKIAKHRVTVERAIGKIKKFKIVSGRIPNSILGNINEIWYVVSMLSNFQPHILKK